MNDHVRGPSTTSRVLAKLVFHSMLRGVLPLLMFGFVLIIQAYTPLLREVIMSVIGLALLSLFMSGTWLSKKLAPSGFFEHWGSPEFGWLFVGGVIWHALLSYLIGFALLLAGAIVAHTAGTTDSARVNMSTLAMGLMVLIIMAGFWITGHRLLWVVAEVKSVDHLPNESVSRVMFPGRPGGRPTPGATLILSAGVTVLTLIMIVIGSRHVEGGAELVSEATPAPQDLATAALDMGADEVPMTKPSEGDVQPPSNRADSEPDDGAAVIQLLARLSEWTTVLQEAFPPSIPDPMAEPSYSLIRHKHRVHVGMRSRASWASSPEEGEVHRLCEAAYVGSVDALNRAFGKYWEAMEHDPDWQKRVRRERDRIGWQPTHYAAYSGHVEALRWLMRKGWSLAARTGVPSEVSNTLSAGITSERHVTPLHLAVMLKRNTCVELMVKGDQTPMSFTELGERGFSGASPLNVGDVDGLTPLDYAYLSSNDEAVRILLEARAVGRLEPVGEATDSTRRLRFRKR